MSGKGKVGILKFVIDDDIDWKTSGNVSLSFQGVHLIDEKGDHQDAYGVSSTIELHALSIAPISFGSDISVYPNPTSSGNLTLSIPENANDLRASILSVTGQEVMVVSNLNDGINSIDVSALQGYYLLQIVSENGLSKSIPLVIE